MTLTLYFFKVYQHMVLMLNYYVINYHKLSILKELSFIILQIFGSEVLAGLSWMYFLRSHKAVVKRADGLGTYLELKVLF